jgi:hypothetical protein
MTLKTHWTPRRNEDEYFAHRDADLLRQQREAAGRAAADEERRSHHMKCPKCGYNLVTGAWHGVHIDQCTHCLGLWVDAVQAQRILGHAPGTFTRIFSALVAGVTGAKVDE